MEERQRLYTAHEGNTGSPTALFLKETDRDRAPAGRGSWPPCPRRRESAPQCSELAASQGLLSPPLSRSQGLGLWPPALGGLPLGSQAGSGTGAALPCLEQRSTRARGPELQPQARAARPS
jgi:hypothetical protein